MRDKDKIQAWINEAIKTEMAIANYKTVGDFSKRSSISSKVDRDLVTHPKAIEKIKRQWEKTEFDFDVFVVNDPRVNKPQFREVGVVDPSFVYGAMRLTPEEIPLNPNNITIIFTNNVAAEKIPLTGWSMAHRLGHAFAASRGKPVGEAWTEFNNHLRETVDNIMREVYGIDTKAKSWRVGSNQDTEKTLKYVAQSLGSMKSARDNAMRNWFEFGYELLAQYLITGHIKLNPLPDNLVVGMGGWGRKQTSRVQDPEAQGTYNNHDLDYFAHGFESYLDQVFEAAQGSVLVM